MKKDATLSHKNISVDEELIRYSRNADGNITHTDRENEQRCWLYLPQITADGANILKLICVCGTEKCRSDYYCHFFKPQHACALYFESGSGLLRVDDRMIEIHAGDFILVREGHEWEWKTNEEDPWQITWINFEIAPIFALLEFYQLPPLSRFHDSNLGMKIKTMFSNFRDSENPVETRDQFLKDTLQLLQHIAQRHSERRIKKKQVRAAGTIMDYINSHIMEPLKVADLAKLVYLSNGAASNAFRAVYHSSIKEYIMRSKTEMAARLLREGELEISEIAERLSFCDTQHFSRIFRNHHNISPAKYRSMFLFTGKEE